MLDGGFVRLSDVWTGIDCGQAPVLIGLAPLGGWAAAGADGVNRVVSILRREFEMAMALTGRTSIAEIDGSVLWPSQQEKTR